MRKYIMAYLRKTDNFRSVDITFGLYSVSANSSSEALGIAYSELRKKSPPNSSIEINYNMVSVYENVEIKRE